MDNTDLKILVEHLTRLEEGDTGAAIGSGLGALVGGRFGSAGAAAGAAAGGYLGKKISDFFDPATKTVVKADPENIKSGPPGSDKSGPSGSAGEPTDDKSWQVKSGPNAATAADQKFFTTNPDGSTSEVTPPPNGWGSNRREINPKTGKEMDKYGNSAGDYTAQDMVAISAGYGGQPSRGGLDKEIQRLEDERGTRLKVVDAWTWKNSVLALLDGDRTMADTARGTTVGIYTEFGSNAVMGGNEFAGFYKRMGYKDFQGDTDIRTKGPFGPAYGALHKMMSPDGKPIVICELYQYYTFQSQKGKGLHMYTVTFIGPEKDWANGGREELQKLHNSIKLSGNVQPLAPPTMQEHIRHLQNKLDHLDKN
jgi:hypothetical protein